MEERPKGPVPDDGAFCIARASAKKPRVSGAEVGGTSDEPRNAVRSTNRRLARPLRSLCDGDHKSALFAAELLPAYSPNRRGSDGGKSRESLRLLSAETPPRSPRGGGLLVAK